MRPFRKARKHLAESSSSGFLLQGKFQQVWQNDALRGGCEVQQRDLILKNGTFVPNLCKPLSGGNLCSLVIFSRCDD